MANEEEIEMPGGRGRVEKAVYHGSDTLEGMDSRPEEVVYTVDEFWTGGDIHVSKILEQEETAWESLLHRIERSLWQELLNGDHCYAAFVARTAVVVAASFLCPLLHLQAHLLQTGRHISAL